VAGSAERGLELGLSTGPDVEDGLLRNHPRIVSSTALIHEATKLHPRLHPRRNGYPGRGALASDAMITMTFQRGTGLTPRQREVVALIAAGCSNDEVGERLGISPRTAKAHSDTLRSKLGVSRRRQIPVAFRVLTGEDPLSASLGALHRPPGV
jgi:DNA-binding CsgD family transcriptional regulator